MRALRGSSLLLAASLCVCAAALASTTIEYDALGRVISVSYGDHTRIDYTYDANGNRTQVVSGVYPNNPPVAALDTYTKAGSSTSTLTVLDNDLDAEGQPLVITGVSAPSAGGTATRINGNTQISYTAGAVGTETFTYTIADSAGGTDTGNITVTVTNVPPVAVNDSYTQTAATTVTLSVLSNDTDANSQPLTITAVGTPSLGGTATRINGNTQISYTSPGTTGTDTFSYTISDGYGGTASATVSVNVQPGGIVATNPNLNSVSGTNATIAITQLATMNGNSGTITVFTPPTTPACGSRTIAANGQSVTYTPPAYTYNSCVSGAPAPRICSIPYTIKNTATNVNTTGTATMSVAARDTATTCQ